jgi:hypothetical protein
MAPPFQCIVSRCRFSLVGPPSPPTADFNGQEYMTDPNSDLMVTKPPPPRWFRWTVLVVISLAMFGNYYVYDAISPIADLLKSQLNFSDSNIGWLNAHGLETITVASSE